jgi:hypothetical protein
LYKAFYANGRPKDDDEIRKEPWPVQEKLIRLGAYSEHISDLERRLIRKISEKLSITEFDSEFVDTSPYDINSIIANQYSVAQDERNRGKVFLESQ